jgi:hypothetical protein
MKNASEKNDSQRSHRYVVVLFSAKISSFSQFGNLGIGNWELGKNIILMKKGSEKNDSQRSHR